MQVRYKRPEALCLFVSAQPQVKKINVRVRYIDKPFSIKFSSTLVQYINTRYGTVPSLVSWWVLNNNSILMHGILTRPWVSIRAGTKLATRVGFFNTPIWFPVYQSLYVLLRGWLPTTDLLRLTLTFQPLFFATDHIQKSPPHIWSFSLISPTRKFKFFGQFLYSM
jgi:hypothetical protein